METKRPMKTIVFHSYKGGVGRSLALSNLAFALSAMGKRVVVMDLDIDAPGLHSKLALASEAMNDWENRVQGGYIDYLAYYFGVPLQPSTKGDRAIVDHRPSAAEVESRC
jgi:Mrp family chromosome partitioning ATPase